MLSNVMKETKKNSTIAELCLEILAGYLDFKDGIVLLPNMALYCVHWYYITF